MGIKHDSYLDFVIKIWINHDLQNYKLLIPIQLLVHVPVKVYDWSETKQVDKGSPTNITGVMLEVY